MSTGKYATLIPINDTTRKGSIPVKQLQIDQLDKSFDKQIIFQGANYTFDQGKVYGLLGRNGSGKSTLFNMIARNIPTDGGKFSLMRTMAEGRRRTTRTSPSAWSTLNRICPSS